MLVGALAGISVLFVGLTVAYLFSKPNWHWQQFPFPLIFLVSTAALLLSSYTLWVAGKAFQMQQSRSYLLMVGLTLLFSVVFLIGQVLGWLLLYRRGIYIGGKPDGSFFYLISGLHVLHVLAGVLVLLGLFIRLFSHLRTPDRQWLYFQSTTHRNRLELITTYWHFVDGLWIYLLVFLLLNHW